MHRSTTSSLALLEMVWRWRASRAAGWTTWRLLLSRGGRGRQMACSCRSSLNGAAARAASRPRVMNGVLVPLVDGASMGSRTPEVPLVGGAGRGVRWRTFVAESDVRCWGWQHENQLANLGWRSKIVKYLTLHHASWARPARRRLYKKRLHFRESVKTRFFQRRTRHRKQP